ncbi:hypothetical protein GCM10027431_18870 [Lysobacter rhizosphaerae]
MPDNSHSGADNGALAAAPQDWSAAFAALPMETPPGDGWTQISRRLDAPSSRHRNARRERRATWLIGMASAAVLVLAAWSPLSRWLQSAGDDTATPALVATTQGLRGPAAPIRAEPAEARVAVATSETKAASDAIAQSTRVVPSHRPHARSARAMPKVPHAASDAATSRLATAATQPPAPGPDRGVATMTAAASDADPLQKLKAQSAQLEALVALARDDRVGNAGLELLSGELDAGIATIDASLSQSDLTATRQQDLWRQRVDLLQQLAGVEATSRWLAAHGTSNDTALVSVD